jgi:ABC-2 type transport system permease protein
MRFVRTKIQQMKGAVNPGRIRALAKKEFFHIIYDPRTLVVLFLLPLVQLIMLGYAMNLEIQHVDLAVVDYSNSRLSRKLTRAFAASPFFRPFVFEGGPEEIEDLFLRRKAQAALIIPHDFDRQMLRNPFGKVQIIVDAADPNAAGIIRSYCQRVIASFQPEAGAKRPWLVDLAGSIYFNPDLKSSYFFVPGIMALILMMISSLLTSVAIAREKEMGTMEQLLVSPVRAPEIIIGKVLPYIGFGLMDAGIILLVGMVLFGVPFQGSFLLLVLLTLLYVLVGLSLGIFISTLARTQQVAMMMANVATVLPVILLSGLIFPIASMPQLLQYLTYLIPAKYYLLIVRGILLKGSGLMHLWVPALFLGILALWFMGNAIRRFKMTVED